MTANLNQDLSQELEFLERRAVAPANGPVETIDASLTVLARAAALCVMQDDPAAVQAAASYAHGVSQRWLGGLLTEHDDDPDRVRRARLHLHGRMFAIADLLGHAAQAGEAEGRMRLALATPTQRDIVARLQARGAERRNTDLAAELGIDPAVVARALAELRRAGLVSTSRLGREAWNRLTPGAVEEIARLGLGPAAGQVFDMQSRRPAYPVGTRQPRPAMLFAEVTIPEAIAA